MYTWPLSHYAIKTKSKPFTLSLVAAQILAVEFQRYNVITINSVRPPLVREKSAPSSKLIHKNSKASDRVEVEGVKIEGGKVD